MFYSSQSDSPASAQNRSARPNLLHWLLETTNAIHQDPAVATVKEKTGFSFTMTGVCTLSYPERCRYYNTHSQSLGR